MQAASRIVRVAVARHATRADRRAARASQARTSAASISAIKTQVMKYTGSYSSLSQILRVRFLSLQIGCFECLLHITILSERYPSLWGENNGNQSRATFRRRRPVFTPKPNDSPQKGCGVPAALGARLAFPFLDFLYFSVHFLLSFFRQLIVLAELGPGQMGERRPSGLCFPTNPNF